MKVVIRKSVASSNFNYQEGEEVNLSKNQAEEFIKYEIAEPLEKNTKKTVEKIKGDADVDDS